MTDRVAAIDGGRARSSRATFTTAGLPASRRLELWEEHNARALMRLSCRTLMDDAFDASGWIVRTRGLRLAHIAAGPHVGERTVREIERRPSDAMLLTVVLSGETWVYDRDGVVTLRPGQAILTDADVASMRGYAHGMEHLYLAVPKPLYREIAPAGARLPHQVFDLSAGGSSHTAGSALVRLLREALHGPGTTDLRGLEQDALGLLGTMVVGPRAGEPESQFAVARAFVRENLADPTLSASRVAAALGVSERQISRIFREHGGVARWITDERLDRARDILTSPGRHSVGQVAQQCGFGSQSYFARVFKQRFAVSPRDVLDAGPYDDRERAAG